MQQETLCVYISVQANVPPSGSQRKIEGCTSTWYLVSMISVPPAPWTPCRVVREPFRGIRLGVHNQSHNCHSCARSLLFLVSCTAMNVDIKRFIPLRKLGFLSFLRPGYVREIALAKSLHSYH